MLSMRDHLETRARVAREMREMREIVEAPEGDGGDLSDEQSRKFDGLKAELATAEKRIERQQALDGAERKIAAPSIISGNGRDGRYEERARSFSLSKAINAALGEPVDAGFEREISTEVRARSGRRNGFQGIAVPDQYFEVEKRVLLVGAGGAAADLYPTMHRPALFIDLLRSALVVGWLGATVLDGLQGDQDIPRQTGSGTAAWLAEDAALVASDATFDDVPLTPHTVGSVTSYSRRTLINASPGIEQIVRADLAQLIAREIDRQALLGDGLNDTPLGVINQPLVNNPTLATPTWAQVLATVAAIQSADADIGALGWAMNPNAVAKSGAPTRSPQIASTVSSCSTPATSPATAWRSARSCPTPPVRRSRRQRSSAPGRSCWSVTGPGSTCSPIPTRAPPITAAASCSGRCATSTSRCGTPRASRSPTTCRWPDAMVGQVERRAVLELRAAGRRLEGIAAPFGTEARIQDFVEVIRPGAFSATLADGHDVVALVDHDGAKLLGRTKTGTLRLREASRGLEFELDGPQTSLGSDVLALADRGDLGGMSFSFRVRSGGERWEGRRRELRAVDLVEVSVIHSWPAYSETEVHARCRPPLRICMAQKWLETC